MDEDYRLSEYDYELPKSAIAQFPVVPRDSSRLLVVESPDTHYHSQFNQLPTWLNPGDLLVLNNTQVIPARLFGNTATGTPVEILLLEDRGEHRWLALVKPGKRFKLNTEIVFSPLSREQNSPQLKATVVDRHEETGGRLLQFHLPSTADFWTLLNQIGQIPFPPYVTLNQAHPSQYQTIYAQELGAVAAPTAGLHFTHDLFEKLANKGVERCDITLHVGVGTFRPVESENIKQHHMHQEWIQVPADTVAKIQATKAKGGRVIAVGTTVVRALEGAVRSSQVGKEPELCPYSGKTDIFIYPGYRWQVIDGLITNFHLPRSSLLMLVSALIGRQRLLSLYQEAMTKSYRFYSFGDAMLILFKQTTP